MSDVMFKSSKLKTNIVFGKMEVSIFRETEISSLELALLESYYALSEERVSLNGILLLNKNGHFFETVNIHNVKINWTGFAESPIKTGGSHDYS